VIKKINSNAYQLELPDDYGVSPTFNVGDLSPYIEDEHLKKLRTISIEEEENDTSQSQLLLSMVNGDICWLFDQSQLGLSYFGCNHIVDVCLISRIF